MLFHLKLSYDQDWDDYDEMVQHAIRNGSAVVELARLWTSLQDYAKVENTSWYRSKERKAGVNPFGSYMMNKKWTLEEDFNNHMLRFQQVTVSFDYFNKPHFNIPGWIDSHRS